MRKVRRDVCYGGLILILTVLLQLFSFSYGAIPVVDFSIFKQAYDAFMVEDGIFDKLRFQLQLFRLLKDKVDIFTRSVLFSLEKLSIQDVEKIMAFNTYYYLEPGYFLIDKYHKEIWYRIFKKLVKLPDQYVLKKDIILRENPLYRQSNKVKQFIDKTCRLQEESIIDLINSADAFSDSRHIQCVRAESIKQWNLYVSRFASVLDEIKLKIFDNLEIPDNLTSNHKMFFLIARLELENLKQKLERNMIRRSELEHASKERLRDHSIFKSYIKNRSLEYFGK